MKYARNLLPTQQVDDYVMDWTESEIALMKKTIRRLECALETARNELRVAEHRVRAGES